MEKKALKNRNIDIIAPNFTNFYRQIFKIFKFMFFMDGTQKTRGSQEPVIAHLVFNLTSNVDRK
jgi:hypothetical protein